MEIRVIVRSLLNLVAMLLALIGPAGRAAAAWILAVVSFDLVRLRRSVIIANISKAFPEMAHPQKVDMGRASMVSFFLTVLEFLGSKYIFPKMKVGLVDPHYLSDALAKGGGAYVLCIHMSNWEMLCCVGTKYFANASVVVKEIGRGAVNEWVKQRRTFNGMYIIARKGAKATQRIFEVIKAGNMVGMVVDQSRPGGERLPFFGVPALTNTGLVQLALRRPAPIIPTVMRRTGRNSVEMVLLEEFHLERTPEMSLEQAITHNSTRMNAVVEKMIMLAPEQYFWMHKRWK